MVGYMPHNCKIQFCFALMVWGIEGRLSMLNSVIFENYILLRFHLECEIVNIIVPNITQKTDQLVKIHLTKIRFA